jgi:hypothetical protein
VRQKQAQLLQNGNDANKRATTAPKQTVETPIHTIKQHTQKIKTKYKPNKIQLAVTTTHEADMIPNKHLDMTHPARNPAQSLSFKIKIQDQADVQSMARPR